MAGADGRGSSGSRSELRPKFYMALRIRVETWTDPGPVTRDASHLELSDSDSQFLFPMSHAPVTSVTLVYILHLYHARLEID